MDRSPGGDFRAPVLPGDTIEYHMKRVARRGNMWWYGGEAKVAHHAYNQYERGCAVKVGELRHAMVGGS